MTDKAIWKFNLEIANRQILAMPAGAEILTAQIQNGAVCLWAIVDTGLPLVKRTIACFGTGHPFDGENAPYIGTVVLPPFGLVFHLFDCGEKP